MTFFKTNLLATSIFALSLGACVDSNIAGEKTANGATVGAVLGGIAGAIGNDDNRLKGAAIGAAAGGAAGAGIGYLLDKQEAELNQSLGNSNVQIVNTGSELVITLPEAITFESNSSHLRGSIQDELITLSKHMERYPNNTLQIIGHTDSSGSVELNQNLSEERAQSVYYFMNSNGVPSSKMQTIGRGETSPIASNDTENGKAQNRRVELIMVPHIN